MPYAWPSPRAVSMEFAQKPCKSRGKVGKVRLDLADEFGAVVVAKEKSHGRVVVNELPRGAAAALGCLRARRPCSVRHRSLLSCTATRRPPQLSAARTARALDSNAARCVATGTPLLVMILSVATCMSASIAFVAAVADESHFASLEVWTLLSGLGAASVAALTHTLYFRIRPAQWCVATPLLLAPNCAASLQACSPWLTARCPPL
eukprot:COSAG06_NODE_221_length_19912_cov_17.460875_25_plen_206_part_00